MVGTGLRTLLRSIGFATGLVSAFPALAQSTAALETEFADILLERRAIHRVPHVNPQWTPPPLQQRGQPAEEIGSLESRRDHEIDYPREARIARREGTATLGFTIDETGRVADCMIVRSSGDIYLDTGSCALLVARGLYRPARDPQGNPIASGQTMDIGWSLEWDALQPFTERITRLSYIVHADGSLSGCWLDRGEGTTGVSHPEMCVGTWPDAALASLHQIAGPGDLHIQTITGNALDEAALERQMTGPKGWTRYSGSGAWHLLDEDGAVTSCVKVLFPDGTSRGDTDPCRPSTRRFAVRSETGQTTGSRIGIHHSWYVQVPVANSVPNAGEAE